MTDLFQVELARSPKRVQNSWTKTVAPVLRTHPEVANPPSVKKLAGWKGLWRYRVGDYRLVYRVDPEENTVVLLLVGHRREVYDRLGHDEHDGPTARIVANLPKLLEREPSEEERGRALVEAASRENSRTSVLTSSDQTLPQKITDELLSQCGIPDQYRSQLSAVTTEAELLSLSGLVPDELIERVMNFLWPPTLEQVVERPLRIIAKDEDLDRAAAGERSLESFLLKLDDQQRQFTSRFEAEDPAGPWIVKGGPGSGKSTVALYCIRNLLHPRTGDLYEGHRPVRILFTTYTRALINSSEHLLKALNEGDLRNTVDITNVDRLATPFLPNDWRNRSVLKDAERNNLVRKAIDICKREDSSFSFSPDQTDFLVDEVEWVIIGNALTEAEQYLAVERPGRGRILGRRQRQHAWNFYLAFRDCLREAQRCLYSQRIAVAWHQAKPRYDYVFIDEAQDLMPVAIKLCIRLCRNPKKVFLTADQNQSIYGTAMSWASVASELNFQGRSRILRRNYRTTEEICDALMPIANRLEGADRDTLEEQPVFHGEYPQLAYFEDLADEVRKLDRFLSEALLSERATAGSAAVLCPTRRDCEEVAGALDKRFHAKAMASANLKIDHPGVKVITMHAAKGLEFPVVAVTRLTQGKMPWPARGGIDPDEHRQKLMRLFFVACSRAMRRLLILGDKERPSVFLENLSDELWDVAE